MASPQKENGFTSIANEIVEALVKVSVPGRHKDVVYFVIRKTYGFNKKSDVISLSQFVFGTNIDRTGVCRILKDLVAWRLLVKNGSSYYFNKNYEDWIVAWRPPPKTSVGSGVEDNLLVAATPHTKETIQKKYKYTSMKRNSFKYNEKNSSDFFEDEVSYDSGELIEEKKSNVSKSMKELVAWSVNERGFPFVNVIKQYTAFKKAREAGISPAKLKERWQEMERDDFWKKNGFDWTNVVSSFDRKK